jgi:DNA repair exonuclease SbcCD nuclease subunit
MLIREMSDIHLEVCPFIIPPMVEDTNTILILAGDVFNKSCFNNNTSINFFKLLNRFRSVIYVPGNHEYYGGHISMVDNDIKNWFIKNDITNIHYLNNNEIVIDNIAFIGSTLWTDVNNGNPISRIDIENGMNDYKKIRSEGYRKLLTKDTIKLHNISKKYIIDRIEFHKNENRKVVVISHHAPSELSIAPKYKNDPLNFGYFSNISEIIDNGPDLYFHGHMHDTFNYILGNTKVICNPRGYAKTISSNYMEDSKINPIEINNPDCITDVIRFNNIWKNENINFNPFYSIDI